MVDQCLMADKLTHKTGWHFSYFLCSGYSICHSPIFHSLSVVAASEAEKPRRPSLRPPLGAPGPDVPEPDAFPPALRIDYMCLCPEVESVMVTVISSIRIIFEFSFISKLSKSTPSTLTLKP